MLRRPACARADSRPGRARPGPGRRGPRPGAPRRRPRGTGVAPIDGATWPCTTCGAANGLDRDSCAACGAGFLSALKATEEPLLVLPVVGDLGALSRAQRLGLAAGVVVAVLLLVLLVGLLLG